MNLGWQATVAAAGHRGMELAQLLEQVCDGVTAQDASGQLLYASEGAARLHGFSSAVELLSAPRVDGQLKVQAVDEAGAPLLAACIPGCTAPPPREPCERTVRLRVLATGEERTLQLCTRPALDGEGAVVHAVTTFRVLERASGGRAGERQPRYSALRADVSAALALKDATLRQMLQGCCEAVVQRLDAAFARVWTLNPSTRVLELEASAGMYTHLDGPHARVPVGELKIGRIAQQGEPHLSNDVGTDPQVGDPAWARREGMVSFAGFPLKVGGEVKGVLALFSRNTLEEETLAALGALADVVAQGLQRKQTEDELEAHAKELIRSNAELEQFAYVASHDLQEPLRMVASYVQLLSRRYQGQLDADADDFIRFAVDGVTRMQELIHDLLSYSRVGTRGKDLAPVESQGAYDRAVKNLQRVIEETGAQVSAAGPLPRVIGDDGQLAQVLQNLIANAIKFRGKDVPSIQVSAEPEGPMWTFRVADNGIGIAPEYFERIFVIFQRLHTRGRYSGNGMGLAICKKIVERHGGRIWVESTLERGSTFCFTLPAPASSRNS